MRLLPDFNYNGYVFSTQPPYTIDNKLIKDVDIFESGVFRGTIIFKTCEEDGLYNYAKSFDIDNFRNNFENFVRYHNHFGEWTGICRPNTPDKYLNLISEQCSRYRRIGVSAMRRDMYELSRQRRHGRSSCYRGSRYELNDSDRHRYFGNNECNRIAAEDLYWGEPVRFNNNVEEQVGISSERIAEISANTGLRCLEINPHVGNLTMHNGDGSSVTLNNVSVSINNASTENDVSDGRIHSDGYGVIGTDTPVSSVDVSAIEASIEALSDSISRWSDNDSHINGDINNTDTIESTENNELINEVSEEDNVVAARGSSRYTIDLMNTFVTAYNSYTSSLYSDGSSGSLISTSDTKNYIHGWSYKPTFVYHTLENEQSPLLLGAEIEVAGNTTKQNERSDRNNVVKKCIQIINGSDSDKEDLLYSTEDSTVQIELDTMPCSLEYHKTMNYKKMFEYLDSEGYKGHDCDNAGLHIHADRKYLGNSVLKQELVISKILYILEKFNDQICRIARRGNTYSKFVGDGNNEKSIAELYKKYRDKGKYVALNLSHKDTIEFRCFKSTLKYETFILTLEFVQDIINFAKQINIEDIETITWDDVMSTFSLELKRYYYNRKEKEEKAKNSNLSNTEVYAATSADVASSRTITVSNGGGINIRSPDDAVCVNHGAEFVHLDRGDIVFSSHEDEAVSLDDVDNMHLQGVSSDNSLYIRSGRNIAINNLSTENTSRNVRSDVRVDAALMNGQTNANRSLFDLNALAVSVASSADNNVASDLNRSWVETVEALQSVGFFNTPPAPLEGVEDYVMTDNSIRANAASMEDINGASDALLRAYSAYSNACNMIDNRAVVTFAQSIADSDEQRNGVSDL